MPEEAKRVPVAFQFHRLNWDFIRLLAEIAHYADGKYGFTEQYTGSRLERDRSPLNHAIEHIRQYMVREPHDHFDGSIKFHLAAAAYNLMMEYYYLEHDGPTHDDILYRRDGLSVTDTKDVK